MQNHKVKIFQSFHGAVTAIDDFWMGSQENNGCYKIMSVTDENGNVVNFVVSPDTYFVNHEKIAVGDKVTGFYDANAPVPLIYPPQLRALVMAKDIPGQNIKVDYFNRNLVSYDGTLKLNLIPSTEIVLENGQAFTGDPTNRNLVVIYGSSTRSIPAQTTPYQIIVLC